MKTLNRREVLGAVEVGVPTIALAAADEKQAPRTSTGTP